MSVLKSSLIVKFTFKIYQFTQTWQENVQGSFFLFYHIIIRHS